MKKTLFSLSLLAGLTLASAQVTIFQDGFEDYDDFTIDNFGDWIQVDVDGGTTWGSEDLDFPNESYIGAGIIFNLSQADIITDGAGYAAYSGDKGLYFFASGASGTAYPNNDWVISPQISLAGAVGSKLRLYAKSLTNQYGPDLFDIAVSTTGTALTDFEFITAPINPGTEYELYEFDLSEFDGQDVYIAINCTTDDGFVLMMDDFEVIADEILAVSDLNKAVSTLYPNPVADAFQVNLSSKFNANNVKVSINDLTGKLVRTFENATSYNIADLASGVYVVTITDGKTTETRKVVKK